MISEIITTYIVAVTNGYETLPVNPGSHCECVKHSRSTECFIGTILDSGELMTVVTTTLHGEPVSDQVTVICRQ